MSAKGLLSYLVPENEGRQGIHQEQNDRQHHHVLRVAGHVEGEWNRATEKMRCW